MLRFIVRRLLVTVLLLWGLLTVVFFLVHAVPGDPVELFMPQESDPEDVVRVRQRLGLDRPVAVQYLDWLGGVARGDLGRSLRLHRPVATIVAEAVPPTLLLTGSAYLLHLVLALSAGVFMGAHRGGRADRTLNVTGLLLYSLPVFWFGLMLVMIFSRQLGWLPSGGMHAPDAEFLGPSARLVDRLEHMVLPVSLLALSWAAGTARYVRNGVAEALEQDHVLAARARGLPERVVLVRYGLRNGLLPVVTLVGLHLPVLLGGAVATEAIFAWPGMGRVTIEAVWARDYPVVMATTFLAGALVALGSLFADILYGIVDPRVRLGRESSW
ncbi:MAG: ABC transporter permease [Candidatus Krumholzibacteriia bacterium]